MFRYLMYGVTGFRGAVSTPLAADDEEDEEEDEEGVPKYARPKKLSDRQSWIS